MVNLTDFTYFICHWNSERNSFNNWRKEIWHIFSFPWLEIWKLMFIFFWKISISKIFKTSRLTWFLGQHTKGKYDIFQTHKTTKLFIYCDVTALLDVCLRILPMLQNRTRNITIQTFRIHLWIWSISKDLFLIRDFLLICLPTFALSVRVSFSFLLWFCRLHKSH